MKPAFAAVWITAWFSGTVESDLLWRILYSSTEWLRVFWSSWNKLLCNRCHIKQQLAAPSPSSSTHPNSLHYHFAVDSQLGRACMDFICLCLCTFVSLRGQCLVLYRHSGGILTRLTRLHFKCKTRHESHFFFVKRNACLDLLVYLSGDGNILQLDCNRDT